MKKPIVIAVDFDGTCVTHEFPNVGLDIGAAPVLRSLVQAGHRLILNTMRSDRQWNKKQQTVPDKKTNLLNDAIEWFRKNNIPLHGIQINPAQLTWTTSPKCYANLYIDDSALGCPLKHQQEISIRPFVDWEKVKEMLIEKGLIEAAAPTAHPHMALSQEMHPDSISHSALSFKL